MFDSFLNLSKKIAKDSAISVACVDFVSTLDNDNAILSFVCSDHRDKNWENSFLPKLESDMSMLGDFTFIKDDIVGFANGYRYYYKVKLNKESIDKFNESYTPVNSLERGLHYKVTNDSFGLKKGTIFTYHGAKDRWRNKLFIISGEIIHDSGTVESVCDFNYETYKFSRAFDVSANSIPKCKVI